MTVWDAEKAPLPNPTLPLATNEYILLFSAFNKLGCFSASSDKPSMFYIAVVEPAEPAALA
jgi:hypothetical protein